MSPRKKSILTGVAISAALAAFLMIAMFISVKLQSSLGGLLAYPVAPFTVSLLAIDAPYSVTASQIALSLSIGIVITLLVYSLLGALAGFLYSKIKTKNGKVILFVAFGVLLLALLAVPTILVY